jgi:AcrR family transcriptional regulator/DNA-binding MarR family transcriptional regulator
MASTGVRKRSRGSISRPAASRRGEDSRAQVSEMQRSRLLAAAVRTVDELGYAGATVAHITQRARVSRRTFYELFANREECVAAVLEDAARRIGAEIEQAGFGDRQWRERVRGGLWAILSFLDREPVLARVCVVQALRGSQGVLERREGILQDLARVLDEGRAEGARGQQCPPLTAEGLVGAAFAIVYARLLRGDPESLTCLLGELMGMIVLPYLGPAAARREQALPVPVSTRGLAARNGVAIQAEHDPLEGIPMRLTYRTARVLEDVAEHPGVSNRMVAQLAGIVDQGQVSKLLARLERLGLLENTCSGHSHGERNAWRLTDKGVQVTQTIRVHAGNGDGGVA